MLGSSVINKSTAFNMNIITFCVITIKCPIIDRTFIFTNTTNHYCSSLSTSIIDKFTVNNFCIIVTYSQTSTIFISTGTINKITIFYTYWLFNSSSGLFKRTMDENCKPCRPNICEISISY